MAVSISPLGVGPQHLLCWGIPAGLLGQAIYMVASLKTARCASLVGAAITFAGLGFGVIGSFWLAIDFIFPQE